MVADLEREWKVALLERGRAGVRLTSEGTRLLPCIRRVCEEHARLQAQVDELNGLQAGLIRIGTFSSVATHWLPNVIRAFQEDYPEHRLRAFAGRLRRDRGMGARGPR